MLYESSLYSTEPLRQTLTDLFASVKHNRRIDIGATDVNTANYVHFNETYEGDDWV